MAGTEFQTVIPSFSTILSKYEISWISSISTNFAPVDKLPNISYTERSKHIDDKPIILSVLSMLNF